MKIGPAAAPRSLRVTVSAGICRSGRVCHFGGVGRPGRLRQGAGGDLAEHPRERQSGHADPGAPKQLAAGQGLGWRDPSVVLR